MWPERQWRSLGGVHVPSLGTFRTQAPPLPDVNSWRLDFITKEFGGKVGSGSVHPSRRLHPSTIHPRNSAQQGRRRGEIAGGAGGCQGGQSAAEPRDGGAATSHTASQVSPADAQPGWLGSSRLRGAHRGRRSGLPTGFLSQGRGRAPHSLRGSVNDEEPAAAAPGVLQVRAAAGAVHAGAAAHPLRPGRRPRRRQGRRALPRPAPQPRGVEPGGGGGGRARAGRGGAAGRPGARGPGPRCGGQPQRRRRGDGAGREAAHLRARHLAHRLVVPGGALQPAPGRVLLVRAHVAPVAGAVPGRRREPAGRAARHAALAVPLRLLGAAAVRASGGPRRALPGRRQPHHGRALSLADQQGHLLAAPVPRRGPDPGGGGPRRGRRLRAQLPAGGPARPGGRVPQVPGGGHQGRAPPGPGRAGAPAAGPGPQPEGGAAFPRPAGRAQLAPEIPAGAAAREHPGAAHPPAGRSLPPGAAGARRGPPARGGPLPRAARRAAHRLLPDRGAGGHLRGLAARPAVRARGARLAAAPLPAAALRGPGAAAARPAPPPAALRRAPRPGRARRLRAQHDAGLGLRGGPALPPVGARCPRGGARLAGAAEPGAGAPGGGRLRPGHAAAGLPSQRGGGRRRARPGRGDIAGGGGCWRHVASRPQPGGDPGQAS